MDVQILFSYKIIIAQILLLCLPLFPFSIYAACNAKLSILEAEKLAIRHAPEPKLLYADAQALEQKAIADRQLPDPKLMLGALNVPTNTFSFTSQDMTMIMIGLEQRFPAGKSLLVRSLETKAEANKYWNKLCNEELKITKIVQETWLDLYYWEHATTVIRANRRLFSYLLKVAESLYSVSKATQSDVLQVELELHRLDNQLLQIKQHIDLVRALLGRWIGYDAAMRPLTDQLPHFSTLPPLTRLQAIIQKHPLIQADNANIQAKRESVAYAEEQFKPGVTLDVSFASREGRQQNGQQRPDFVSAQATIDLPIFPSKRQIPRLHTSVENLEAAFFARDTHYLDLMKAVEGQYRNWNELAKRKTLYATKLVPEAKQNAKAALLAYRSATVDMSTVLRAYTDQLNVQLEQLQIKIEQLKTRTILLYLEGKAA